MTIQPYHVYLTVWKDSPEYAFYNYLIPVEDLFIHYSIYDSSYEEYDGTIEEVLDYKHSEHQLIKADDFFNSTKSFVDLGEFHSQQAFEDAYPELLI